jgi:7-cyano-7-deazaguanine synthase in queuosine biosynthesis
MLCLAYGTTFAIGIELRAHCSKYAFMKSAINGRKLTYNEGVIDKVKMCLTKTKTFLPAKNAVFCSVKVKAEIRNFVHTRKTYGRVEISV